MKETTQERQKWQPGTIHKATTFDRWKDSSVQWRIEKVRVGQKNLKVSSQTCSLSPTSAKI